MSTPSELREGIDYYIDRGRWVFTASYLLARGHCCQSGCRHCPYSVSVADSGEETKNPARPDSSPAKPIVLRRD